MELKSKTGPGGTVRPCWDQRLNVRCHSIELAPCSPWVKPHKLAHELTHIALECEAHLAGRRKSHFMQSLAFHRLLSLCDPSRRDESSVLKKLFSYSVNVPVDLVVEARLQRDIPDLAPAQFINLHKFEDRNTRTHLATQSWEVSPKLRLAFDTLMATRALFVDTLVPSTVKWFNPYRGTAAGDLAGKLHAEFQTAFTRGMAPGDHYILADRFADLIGLPGLHAWSPKPIHEMIAEQSAPGIS